MNHHELLTLIQSCQAILTFLVNRGLLAARRRCSCGDEMVLRDDKSDDGYHWECPVNQCRKRRSIRAGSFFEYSKIPMSHWLYIIFLWYGRERHWTSSGIPRTEQDKRNLGDWTSTEVRRAWNNNNLRQVFAIFQPEQCRLHTPCLLYTSPSPRDA